MLVPMLRKSCAFAVLALPWVSLAQTQSSGTQLGKDRAQQRSQSKTQRGTQSQSEGERIFVQNCARCHNPPEGFSPRISGTIAVHMRVRASMSEHDEQELMRYFNP